MGRGPLITRIFARESTIAQSPRSHGPALPAGRLLRLHAGAGERQALHARQQPEERALLAVHAVHVRHAAAAATAAEAHAEEALPTHRARRVARAAAAAADAHAE